MSDLLIVFIKNPVRGKVKTRLAATIGEDKALQVYESLLHHTLSVTKDLKCDKIVYYSDFLPQYDDWANAGFQQAVQTGDDLGKRMHRAFQRAFNENYKRVVIIGSDCLELRNNHLVGAFQSLNQCNAVIGPARDGGYYLLGLTRLHDSVFANKEWSSASVFGSTLDDFRNLKLTYTVLDTLSDIDNESDLQASNFKWV